jgi:hypothetical protein
MASAAIAASITRGPATCPCCIRSPQDLPVALTGFQYCRNRLGETAALGLGLGVGYDFRLGRNFSLTPYANVVFRGENDRKLNDVSTGIDASFSLIQIGLGFTWH